MRYWARSLIGIGLFLRGHPHDQERDADDDAAELGIGGDVGQKARILSGRS